MPSSLTPLARFSTLPLQLFLFSQVSKPGTLICGICLCLRCLVSPPSPLLHLSRRLRLRFSPCSLCLQRVSWPTGIAPLARRPSPPSVVHSNKGSFAASPTSPNLLSPNIPSIFIYLVRALGFAPQGHILVPTEDPSLLPWPRCLSPSIPSR